MSARSRSRRRTVLVGAALMLLGCEAAPPLAPPSASTPNTPSIVQLRREGDGRRQRGDLAGALAAYEAALTKEPSNVQIRYLSGVVLAALDRPDETTAAFVRVVRDGAAGSEEVALARQWLAASAAARRETSRPADISANTAAGSAAQLQGKTEWRRLNAERPAPRLQLLLVGDDPATQGRRYAARTALNEPYRFSGVPPGEYRLLAQVGMTRLWSTKVVLQEGRTTVLDLTEATAVAPPDALRQPMS